MRVSLLCVVVSLAHASVLDLFESTHGNEPRVAVNCGKLPFHVDLETGAWITGDPGTADSLCDETDKEIVKSHCKQTYPSLNVTNIVEANKQVLFSNWCTPGSYKCQDVKQVTPYRCLVHEYEADALMVPNGCTFDHKHDETLCLKHDDWKVEAKGVCHKQGMKLDNYGILLSCGTDVFTGVEFVCCPPKQRMQLKKKMLKKLRKKGKKKRVAQREQLATAIIEFQKFLPLEIRGCDRSQFGPRETAMEERHRDRIAAVVDEWDEAEKRYNRLKSKDPVAAEEKMKRTLDVFRETLAALEEEAKEEKQRLRAERATCINTQIAKSKRDAMLDYIVSVEEEPADADRILETVKKFIEVCEHDRVHSLRHFEHVRNRNLARANLMRGELLQHLKDLNTMVNESMAMLTHLPKIAEKFGLNDMSVMLKPRLMMPEVQPTKMHMHENIPDELLPLPEEEDYDDSGDVTVMIPPEVDVYPADGTREPTDAPTELVKETTEPTTAPVKEIPPVTTSLPEYEEKEEEKLPPAIVDEDWRDRDEGELVRDRHAHPQKAENQPKIVIEPRHHHRSKRSAGFAAVIGLSCGALVIMLGILVALVVRRKRVGRDRVMIPTVDNDDQEHLVQMQKKGFENPTYKFYYY